MPRAIWCAAVAFLILLNAWILYAAFGPHSSQLIVN